MHLHCLEYGMPSPHGEVFISAELKSQVDSFLKRALKYDFCSRLYTIDTIAEDADIDLFCKMTKNNYCAHSLLPPVKSCTHYLRPKEHTYELPRCNSEVYKSHLYPVASFGICNLYLCFYGNCVFIFYFNCHFSTVCTFVTCLLNINQSIDQLITFAVD